MFASLRASFRNTVANWGGSIALGVFTAAVIWTVWYFTKTPCIMAKAAEGLCNPSVIAHFINADILTKAGGGGLAVGALKVGYNTYMLNREREARRQAEEQLAEARNEVAEARKEVVEAHRRAAEELERAAEQRQRAAQERERAAEEARQRAAEEGLRVDTTLAMFAELISEIREERRQNVETQQAMLDTLVQLVQQQRNGGRPTTDETETPGND